MRRLTLVLFSLALTLSLGATSQAPDVLKADGKTYSIFTNPLGPWLAANPNKLPKADVISSGLWRGYIATFAIRNDHLYVDDVVIPKSVDEYRSVMKELFGDSEPHLAQWYTGRLIVPTGKLVNYVHMGYASTYSSYMVVTVVKGAIRDKQDMDQEQFEQFRRAQFAAFKKTPEYAKDLAEAKKGDNSMSDKDVEEFIYQYESPVYLSRVFEPPAPHAP